MTARMNLAEIAPDPFSEVLAIAGLEDLDVAAAITKLQQALLTEQASQQSFVKINGTSLFDYLR